MSGSRGTDAPTEGDVFPGIQVERVQELNDGEPVTGARYVLYWMQQSQRTDFNHALEYAVHRANELDLPVLVCFGLTDDYPEANARHYLFMLQGLRDVAAALDDRGITFVLRRGAPPEVAIELADKAALVVCDRGYLRNQREWREQLVAEVACPVVQVESDVVVPVELVSDKREHAARTIRPKITKHLDRFLVALPKTKPTNTTRPRVKGIDVSDPDAVLETLKLDRSVPPVAMFEGGSVAAAKQLRGFLSNCMDTYSDNRNQPQTDDVSHMSKYLHFGQISPVDIALQVRKNGSDGNADDFLEELIVRRELPMNFVFYEPHYDAYRCLPDFAKKTLSEHEDDPRDPQYTRGQLEAAETDDEYWNAAMKELLHTGYMHNYMRMYWGKKILEWSASPQTAYRTTLYLNNKYFIDGRDANSFSNVSWVFGNQDRGWTERAVFGKIRYMAASGLERKAKPQEYVEKVERLVAEVTGESDEDSAS